MTNGEIRRRLVNGLGRLRKNGWCQGDWYKRDSGKMCALGCVERTMRGGRLTASVEEQEEVAAAIWRGVREANPQTRPGSAIFQSARGRVMDWNDRKGRTAGQVKKAFRAAIKLVGR